MISSRAEEVKLLMHDVVCILCGLISLRLHELLHISQVQQDSQCGLGVLEASTKDGPHKVLP